MNKEEQVATTPSDLQALMSEFVPQAADDTEREAKFVETVQQMKGAFMSIQEVLNDNPELAEVIRAMAAGDIGFIEALATVMTPEEYAQQYEASQDGEPFRDKVNRRRAELQTKADADKQREANFQNSQDMVLQWQEQRGLSDEDMQAFAERLDKLQAVFADGKVTMEELDDLYYLMNREGDLAAAHEEGKVAGKTERYVAKKKQEVADAPADVPGMGGSGGAVGEQQKPERGFFDDVIEQEKAKHGRGVQG